jgi:serine O-acetyltransferase
LLWAIYRTIDFAVVNVLFNAEIPGQTRIGPRLRLPHGGRGVVIHPAVEIGADVTIFHQVTIGVRGPDLVGLAPTIGDRVFIGVGAKVLGQLHVGEDARVGANAVVVKDVSAGRTAVGIPASVKQVQEPNTAE